MEDRPESSRRIHEEMKELDLLSGGKEKGRESGIPVKLLIERGELEQYMVDRPESSRRIQGEMKDLGMIPDNPTAKWEKKRTPDGKIFYVNHEDKTTHWTLPAGVKLGASSADGGSGWRDWISARLEVVYSYIPESVTAAMPSFSFSGTPDAKAIHH